MTDLWRRVSRAVSRAYFGPRVPVETGVATQRLGSKYGGWVFVDLPELQGATIVSCGLGEDASFDVEFAAHYGARVILVDPTPRALDHFARLSMRFGSSAQTTYAPSGLQPVEAYDLTRVSSDQLEIRPVALTTSDGRVRFYEPCDPTGVSHSLVNFQNGYSRDTPFIEVDGMSVASLMATLGGVEIPLIKFDIEGAEISVIPSMLDLDFAPRQILVEFDELNFPSRRARRNFDTVDQLLVKKGYSRVFWDGRTCVTYLKRDRL